MVQLILGDKGKGKTKYLLDEANKSVQGAAGDIVYLDKNSKHMYELNNHIRLVDVSSYPICNADQFIGFIAGILSQNHDIEKMYFDNFLILSQIDKSEDTVNTAISGLNKLSALFNVDMIVGMSADKADISEELQEQIAVVL